MQNVSEEEKRYSDVYSNHYEFMRNIMLNRFEWKNLPNGIEPRHIERTLIDNGQLLFYNSKEYGLVALPCTADGGLDIYGDFTSFRTYGFGGQTLNESVPIEKGVLVKNNKMFRPTNHYLTWFARRLADIDISVDINVLGQRTPYFIITDERTRLSMKNIWRKIVHGAQAIFTSQLFQEEQTIVHQTVAPYVSDKLSDLKSIIRNEFLTFAGINNSAVDKKERLVTAEADGNNQYIKLSIDNMLSERKEAVERINKMFNLNITVELRCEDYGTVHADNKTTGGE